MPAPIILWFRRDLRLSDHAALCAACATGRPVIPVFIHDDEVAGLGAAPKWRLGLSIEAHARALGDTGSRLILRRGAALDVLRDLLAETGADTVWWSRTYHPQAIARDKAVKAALTDAGIAAKSFAGHTLFEPWQVKTGQGGFYRVYTPYWRAVRDLDLAAPMPAPVRIAVPERWPASDTLADWAMGATMNRGARVVAPYQAVGEEAARDRLDAFIETGIARYNEDRDFPAKPATSGLSENLTYGEIAPSALWHAGQQAMQRCAAGAEHFLKEVVWRDFAYHLVYHTPHITTGNWREGWDAFPWAEDDRADAVMAWKQGRTGIPFVDAAMREMYVTGTMHNRARMIVASYLTKHLLTHWRVGLDWFAECLTDWDPASNAMGWQWAAGSGPDAAPYFRVFNPETQLQKFDPDGAYRRRWIAEGCKNPSKTALSWFDAVPRSWGLAPDAPYPSPIVALDEGRKRALAAYEARTF